jgi:hypothetical protein
VTGACFLWFGSACVPVGGRGVRSCRRMSSNPLVWRGECAVDATARLLRRITLVYAGEVPAHRPGHCDHRATHPSGRGEGIASVVILAGSSESSCKRHGI